ncbi:Uncharacterized protein FWK35_00029234, partial [Aphis craccivora]
MPALQGIEVSIGNPWLMLRWWQFEITRFSSTTKPLYSFLYGNTIQSKHFLANTQKYNGIFQMTSFGAE